MKELYTSPELKITCFAPVERLANDGEIEERIRHKYLTLEQKTVVELDREKIAVQGAEVIAGDIFCLEREAIRHNALKTAYLIFSYLMDNE